MQNEIFILDSNIWISYVISKRLHELAALIQKQQLTILTSQPLVDEIRKVLSRPKFKKYITKSDIKEVVAIHLKLCQFVGNDKTSYQLSDQKDNFLINLYNRGEATILLSGDKTLLREAILLNCHVMTLREFESHFNLLL